MPRDASQMKLIRSKASDAMDGTNQKVR